ncbi:CRISPR system Cascade subunit CasE [Mobiluncus mulieris]|uniref:CRISPR-associated protein Cas6/Cse3/CasE, subtype I-E/ECOLI n=1 Tax=Mobiluncus mulieris TaxID=2052 RepID=A0A8G2HX39_9ACTO|nr:type I-E CRISPR-associated protein Cas6/Cse3/CasE [Mobiluncus mulieris]MBB5846386.1 CRISPR system Cascade subunit CasE [Mobiluncus mulieris]MCV0012168.1 type I-E CRISPR-associated protein Cas6/Cse3/CasE [Mobiluncus mulieris]STO17133.1 CRISPR-associated protein Cas6/Cse3/CasE, subtype I-E/ECOLI [Mobiluncus mulieris]
MVYITLVPAHMLVKPEFRAKLTRVFKTPDFRHRAVMDLFPEFEGEQNPRAAASILFRLETLPGLAPRFVVQSDISPAVDKLPKGVEPLGYTFPELGEGTPVSFRLAVNPVIRHSQGKDGQPARTTTVAPFGKEPAESAASLETWLSQKLSPGLAEVNIINAQREIIGDGYPNQDISKIKRIVIDLVDGVACVGDAKTLNKMLRSGVGRAKSYGCGLLSVKQL